jgi:hypothetical protein
MLRPVSPSVTDVQRGDFLREGPAHYLGTFFYDFATYVSKTQNKSTGSWLLAINYIQNINNHGYCILMLDTSIRISVSRKGTFKVRKIIKNLY